MTKQEAIDILVGVITTDSEEENEALDLAIEALQFQDIMVNNPKSAKPTPEVCKNCADNKQNDWTPVTKSTLPDIDDDVNVTIKDFAETRTGFLAEEGWWLITKEGMLENYPIGYVVAWQPLPEPYREESEIEK